MIRREFFRLNQSASTIGREWAGYAMRNKWMEDHHRPEVQKKRGRKGSKGRKIIKRSPPRPGRGQRLVTTEARMKKQRKSWERGEGRKTTLDSIAEGGQLDEGTTRDARVRKIY